MGFAEPTSIQRARKPDLIPGYRLTSVVGRGGMGEVHQATQLSLGRVVAVKLLQAELAKDSQFVARFDKEAAALATLRHPNIVSIVDRGTCDDTYYLVMEYVDGPSLRERMRDPDFDSTKALLVLSQVGRAVDYAHGRGVIHRDLKPENILFDMQAGGIPKVTDFGLAGFDERSGMAKQNLTQTHVSMGTASYMAPEQRVDAKSAGAPADLYSLGVMLYEMLVGDVPVGTYDPPSVRKPSLDKRLDAIVARCLKASPDDRYPSVAALLTEIEALIPGMSLVSASPETKVQRLARRARELGRRVLKVGAITSVLVTLVLLTVIFARSNAESSKVPAGVELMMDFGTRFPLSTPGRVDKESHLATLGDGPDTIGVMALGRTPRLDKGAIRYGAPENELVGRAVIDAEMPGEGLFVQARVDTQPVVAGRLEPLWAVFRGARPDARSALMLLGEHGRYVALIVSGSQAEPTLEWALGPDKRGAMRAPLPTSTTQQLLGLRIDPATGDLSATIGEGRDERVLGDRLNLGPDWKKLFVEPPRAAVGCLEGTCAFSALQVSGLSVPLPPPPLVAPPPPPPEPHGVTKPAATKPKPVVKPAPRPDPKAPTKRPSGKGKR